VGGASSSASVSLESLEDYYPPRILLKITHKDDTPQRPLKCQLEIRGTDQSEFFLNLYLPNITKKLTERTPHGMWYEHESGLHSTFYFFIFFQKPTIMPRWLLCKIVSHKHIALALFAVRSLWKSGCISHTLKSHQHVHTNHMVYSPLCRYIPFSHSPGERTSGRGNSEAYKGYYPSTQWVRSGL